MSLDRLLTIKQLSAETGLSQGEIRSAIASGHLAVVRRTARSRMRVAESSFRAWQQQHTASCEAPTLVLQFNPPSRCEDADAIEHLLSAGYIRRFS